MLRALTGQVESMQETDRQCGQIDKNLKEVPQ